MPRHTTSSFVKERSALNCGHSQSRPLVQGSPPLGDRNKIPDLRQNVQPWRIPFRLRQSGNFWNPDPASWRLATAPFACPDAVDGAGSAAMFRRITCGAFAALLSCVAASPDTGVPRAGPPPQARSGRAGGTSRDRCTGSHRSIRGHARSSLRLESPRIRRASRSLGDPPLRSCRRRSSPPRWSARYTRASPMPTSRSRP